MAGGEADDTDDSADQFHRREVNLSLKSHSVLNTGNMDDFQNGNEEKIYQKCCDKIVQADRTGEGLLESPRNILSPGSAVEETGSSPPKLTPSNMSTCETKAEECCIDGRECTKVDLEKLTVLPKKVPYDHGFSKKTIKNTRKGANKDKAKKWRNLDLEDVGICPTLFPRPVQAETTVSRDMMQEYERFVEADFNEIEGMITNKTDFEVYKALTIKRVRSDRHQKIRKAGKQVKDKYFRSVKNNNGKRLYIRHRTLRTVTFKLTNLDKRKLHFMPKPKWKDTNALEVNSANAKSNPTTGKNAKLKKTPDKPKPPPAAETKHALHSQNLPSFISAEQGLADLLIALQHRDLSPEDYELLSRLDEQVAPKTVSNKTLSGFKTEEVTEADCGEYCAICMEVYTMGQKLKYLPCEHRFHSSCIDMWLQNSSMNCPLDGLPVDQ